MADFLIKHNILFEAISYLVVIGSIPTAVYSYYKAKKKEISDREYGTFDSLDDKFIEFQLICMEKPYLDIFDVPDENPIKLTSIQKKEELVAYSILFAIFERAFVMYKERSFKDKSKQWDGWVEVMELYVQRDNFLNAWEKNGFGWDCEFQEFINSMIAKNKEIAVEKNSSDEKVGE
ncbi:MAG: hypothetical protein R6U59_01705 [Eubacteriales bacterium]